MGEGGETAGDERSGASEETADGETVTGTRTHVLSGEGKMNLGRKTEKNR